MEHFVAGTPARTTAQLCGVNRKTATTWYHKFRKVFRKVISEKLNNEQVKLEGEIEVDESYFGGIRKGKRGRGAGGKTIVFGLYKRNGYVHTQIVRKTNSFELFSIIKNKVKPHSIVYTDSYKSYNILDISDFQHHRINHSKEFAKGKNHINGIENFWNQAKRHLRKYNGIPKQHFYLYLKECEWRFNYRPIKNMKENLKNWIKEANLA